jgi:hypothetical protein
MRKSRAFLAFLLAFLAINGLSIEPDTIALKSDAISLKPEIISLSCADQTSYEIRVSNVINGCKETEYSLGATAINRSIIRPTDIEPQLFYRFKAAQAAAKKQGQALYIASGFRSLARQEVLFTQAIKKYGTAAEASKWVAPPLVSNHPWGIAIDVNYPNEPIAAGWLEINGAKFGLCRVYENEWWHFEPVIAPGEKCPALVPDATYSSD